VPLIPCIAELLKRERIPYVAFGHPPAYTAKEQAAVSHSPVDCTAKVVICFADGSPVQAVVPAHQRLDLNRLRVLAGAAELRLAREEEIADLYPEFEIGAMPPFGMLHGHRVFVERCFVGEPEMVFHAGRHTEAIRMHYEDFAALAKPVVGQIGLGAKGDL
jgi:Ala-tRNA(Pro) deacylase